MKSIKFPRGGLMVALTAMSLTAAVGCGGSDDSAPPAPGCTEAKIQECESQGKTCQNGECVGGDLCTAEVIADCQAQGKVCNDGECEFAAPKVVFTVAGDDRNFSDEKELTVSVTLDRQPSKAVTLKLSTADAKTAVTPESVVIHSDVWPSVATFTVKGIKDEVNDGTRGVDVVAKAESEDADFDGLEGKLALTSNDTLNDAAEARLKVVARGETVMVSGGATPAWFEGEKGQLCVTLDKQPSADVTVTYGSNDLVSFAGEDGRASLTFTTEDFGVEQCLPFSVVATDDVFNGGQKLSETRADLPEDHALYTEQDTFDNYTDQKRVKIPLWTRGELSVAATVNTDDEAYKAAAGTSATVGMALDQNGPAVLIAGEIPSMVEGETTYTQVKVKLAGRPSQDVAIIFAADQGKIEAADEVLTIHPDDWNTGATFQLRAVKDGTIEGEDELVGAAFAVQKSSTYAEAAAVHDFVTVDGDTCNLVVDAGQASLLADGTWNVSVKLSADPGKAVTVSLAMEGATGNATLSPSELTFTSTNYGTAQTVQVKTSLFDMADWKKVDSAFGDLKLTISGTDPVKGAEVLTRRRQMIGTASFAYDTKYAGGVVTLSKKDVHLPKGTYKLEAWGASGGRRPNDDYGSKTWGNASLNDVAMSQMKWYDDYCNPTGSDALLGKGAYAAGTLTLTEGKDVCAVPGSMPVGQYGGANGGGAGVANLQASGHGGGGASDIRVGACKDAGLDKRILVAAGAGGEVDDSGKRFRGGNGCKDNLSLPDCLGTTYSASVSTYPSNEKDASLFGQGQNCGRAGCGGGGGGWFGGSAFEGEEDTYSGNGGTSFCFEGRSSNYDAIMTTVGMSGVDNGFGLADCQLISGGDWKNNSISYKVDGTGSKDSQCMYISGEYKVMGHRGHGHVVITPLDQ